MSQSLANNQPPQQTTQLPSMTTGKTIIQEQISSPQQQIEKVGSGGNEIMLSSKTQWPDSSNNQSRSKQQQQQQSSFMSQPLTDMAIKKNSQRQQGTTKSSVLKTTGSNQNMTMAAQGLLHSLGPSPPPKRSLLEEAGGSQLHEGSKFRLSSVNNTLTQGLTSAQQPGGIGMFAQQQQQQQNSQAATYARGFRGTGNLIAAVGSPPIAINKTPHQGGSTLGLQDQAQQPPHFISRINRASNPVMYSNGETNQQFPMQQVQNKQQQLQIHQQTSFVKSNRSNASPIQVPRSGAERPSHGSLVSNATNSAGRKVRNNKSRSKRRFSSSSINQNVDNDTQLRSRGFYTNGQVGKDPVGGATMSQAAAQIIKVNGEQTKATIASANMASMSAAYSSVGELNIPRHEPIHDRFNSRAQTRALNSMQTAQAQDKEQLYNQMYQMVDATSLKPRKHMQNEKDQLTGAHYGTHPSIQQSVGTVANKKYSNSVNRRNHQGLHETASGKNLDQDNNQDHQSQHSNKNFNSLRNSKSMHRKLSATASKKNKKLKKSESQVRHQQITKSELMTQHNHIADNSQVTSPGHEQNQYMHSNQRLITDHPQGLNPRQDSMPKRVQNRTPQGFQQSDKINAGSAGSNNLQRGSIAHSKQDAHKGQNAASSIQVNGNMADLHKNAMHIKKLNFMGRGMQSHATQPIIPQQYTSQYGGAQIGSAAQSRMTTNSGLEPLQQLQLALHNQAKEMNGAAQLPKTNQMTSAERQQFINAQTINSNGANFHQNATSTIESLLRQHSSKTGQTLFNDFKSQFGSAVNPQGQQPQNASGGAKTYKLMKSAERGEINTHNLVMCQQHTGTSGTNASSKGPCTCSSHQPSTSSNGTNTGTFQSKASANFQKTFRQGNFVYHGSRRSNDFSTIQTRQSTLLPNGAAPFQANLQAAPQQQQMTTPHITQGAKREDANKFGGNFNAAQAQAQMQNQQQQSNNALNPLMSDLLQYLQQAYSNQQKSIGNTGSAPQQVPGPVPVPAPATIQTKAPTVQQETSATRRHPQQVADGAQMNELLNQGQKGNKLIHFEKGDRIIYEPNEMHQLKYINEKGDVSPITGVQYILTQPNFSKGRPCHFFVVNKQEFEAATKGFKLKQEEQKAEELAKQKKLQAVANIRSHRASQKIRQQNTAKGGKKVMQERKQSAKGGRNGQVDTASKDAKAKEEEKKDEKNKYHNENYTYQKLRSLKWMGGVYKNPHDDPAPIWRPSAEETELRQQLEAKREIKAKYNLLSLAKQDVTELYKYILYLGNNHEVVKRVMDVRPSWVNIKSSQTLYNFKWAPSSRQIKFDLLCKHGQKNLVNHFENHALITTKDQLIESMSKLCENLHQDMFSMIPLTFIIDLGTSLCQQDFDKFVHYFNVVEKSKEQFNQTNDPAVKQEMSAQLNRNLLHYSSLTEKKRKYASVTMKETLFDGHNMWLFKPADANRGRGVNLFNSIEQLKKLIVEHTSRAESKQFQNFAHANNIAVQHQQSQPAATEDPSAEKAAATSVQQPAPVISTVKSDVFVLQKYIEKPLLISQRKFDIRLWVLVTAEHKCYYFKEGYIRMSGQEYDMSQTDNLIVHLTNNAIQKHDNNYGQFEEGNILSFAAGSEFLKKQDGIEFDFYDLLRDEMVPIIETTMMSVRQKINKNNRKFCMEIFGYDFMVDAELRPWLIEVNTNPCLEESNALLRQLVPRMLDDAFKLTIDLMFPPIAPAKIAEALGEEEGGSHSRTEVFKVDGHADAENLWGEQPFYILRVPGAVVLQGS